MLVTVLCLFQVRTIRAVSQCCCAFMLTRFLIFLPPSCCRLNRDFVGVPRARVMVKGGRAHAPMTCENKVCGMMHEKGVHGGSVNSAWGKIAQGLVVAHECMDALAHCAWVCTRCTVHSASVISA